MGGSGRPVLPVAFVANLGGGVSVVNASTNAVHRDNRGRAASGVAFNPAGTNAYVADDASGNVSVVNTSTDTVTPTIAAGTYPNGVAINPATTSYVTNGGGTVSVIDTAADTVTSTITGFNNPHGVVVNPAGTITYVADPRHRDRVGDRHRHQHGHGHDPCRLQQPYGSP